MDDPNTNQTIHPDTEVNVTFQQQSQNNLLFLKSLKNWSNFQAILEIITGAFMCLGIITAIIGVPKIIAGVKLLNAGDNIREVIATGDERQVTHSLYNMGSYFKLNGISNIISISLSLLSIVLWIVLVILFINKIGDFVPWNFDYKYEFNY